MKKITEQKKSQPAKVLYTEPYNRPPASQSKFYWAMALESSHQVIEENKETGWKRYADGHESYPFGPGIGGWRGF